MCWGWYWCLGNGLNPAPALIVPTLRVGMQPRTLCVHHVRMLNHAAGWHDSSFALMASQGKCLAISPDTP